MTNLANLRRPVDSVVNDLMREMDPLVTEFKEEFKSAKDPMEIDSHLIKVQGYHYIRLPSTRLKIFPYIH